MRRGEGGAVAAARWAGFRSIARIYTEAEREPNWPTLYGTESFHRGQQILLK
jgi:hypothetical protein